MISKKYYEKNLPEYLDNFMSNIIQRFDIEKYGGEYFDESNRYTPIELLNIILSISDFGEGFFLSTDLIEKAMKDKSYFVLISVLSYIKNHKIYDAIRLDIESKILKKCTISSPVDHSETAHLLLDALSCPYISHKGKKRLVRLLPSLKKINNRDCDELISNMEAVYWFVNWKNIDLIQLLQRSQLITPY